VNNADSDQKDRRKEKSKNLSQSQNRSNSQGNRDNSRGRTQRPPSKDQSRSSDQSRDRALSRENHDKQRDGSQNRQKSNTPERSRTPQPWNSQNRDAKSDLKKGDLKFVEDRAGNRIELTGNRTKDWSEGDIDLGYNCARNYDPSREKRCLKCLTENQHHKFNCQKFDRRSRYNCRNCEKGFHWPEDCNQDNDPVCISNKNQQNKGN
jgi:hypothetical protein